MTIHLYAEHLVNIRTLSIQASLSTVSNKETQATLAADGSTLRLEHQGEVATIRLPIQVPGGHNDATLTIPAAPTKDLSFRVQLQEKADSSGLLTNGAGESDNIVPWTADTLTADTSVACKQCRSILITRRQVKLWKNLPSENWAEMMDFWHCHRPHVPHNHDHKAPVKGYSADSTLVITPGVGMVDPVDLVLAAEDCSNLKTSPSTSGSSDEVLQCLKCAKTVGHVHTSGGYKIRKQHMYLSASLDEAFRSYDVDKWLACLLIASIDTQGVRKFAVQPTAADTAGLKIWIFTPDINVSSSLGQSGEPTRAMKVFWQDCSISSQDVGTLNRQALMEGELELPQDEIQQLREKFVESASALPESARRFQEWNVALLRRFTSDDIA